MPNDAKKAMQQLSAEINGDLDSFFDDVLKEVEKNTPVDTGRARKGWKKNSVPQVNDASRTDDVIVNSVPYAKYLNADHDILKKAVDKTWRRYR